MSVVGAGIYINRQFGEMNIISTRSARISSHVFDNNAVGVVDTDRAQQVLEIAESGQTGLFSLDTRDDSMGPDLSGVFSYGAGPSDQSFTLNPVLEFVDGTMNILLMGVDAHSGDEIDIGVRPDSLSVLHLDKNAGSCRILTIPRDTRVELPGYGDSKINHALAVGGVPTKNWSSSNSWGLRSIIMV